MGDYYNMPFIPTAEAVFDYIVGFLDHEIEQYNTEVVQKHCQLLVFRNYADNGFLNHIVGQYQQELPCHKLALVLKDQEESLGDHAYFHDY